MNFTSRLRRVGYVVALLMAVLLVAPTIDCGLLGNAGHPHLHLGAAGHVDSAASGDHAHVVDMSDDGCGPHMTHCIVKSVLPGAAGSILLLQLLTLILALVVAFATAGQSTAGGVRGPPVASLSAVGGREILTRFCIARR